MSIANPPDVALVFRCAHCGAINRVREGDERTPICGRCKDKLDVTGAPQSVSDSQLEKLVRTAPVPVLVDFWAPWCGPCRLAAPILDRIARAHRGAVLVVKLNGDDHPDATARHGVRGIPTFVVFRGGKETARQTGLLPERAFQDWVSAELEPRAHQP